MTFVKRLFFILISAVAAAVAPAGDDGLPRNFHEVDAENGIYRSAQPDHEEFAALEKRGFRTVLNLRNFHSDRRRLEGLKIRECPVPCNAGSMTGEHVYEALRIIRDEPKPLLIHCWHGSDRTGTVVAAYRIVFNGRDVETAIAEMCEKQYGHHAGIYANLPELLRSIDWEKMRTRLMNEDLMVGPFEPDEVLLIDFSPEPFRVTVNGAVAENADAALALIRNEWKKTPYRIALLVFDRDPGDTLFEPFAMRLNALPELREATRIDALPVEMAKDAMPEFCRRFGLEENPARKIRVIPHRVRWPLPARTENGR